jgi:phosphohistidine phosphatase SixA
VAPPVAKGAQVLRAAAGTTLLRTATIHLIRHAKAGSRQDWAQPDELRPLTDAGRRQAKALAEELADAGVKRVLSSRYTRCVQTVEPLADALGLEVETHPALAEEADLAATWSLVEELAPTGAALCTHGNVVDAVVDRLHRRGVKLVGHHKASGRKASVWALEARRDGTVRRATHTPPPT